MKTRWMLAGSLLTLIALALVAVLGGVALAQPGTDEATPEPPVVEEDAPRYHEGRFAQGKHFKGLLSQEWQHADDWDWDMSPLARLAEILGLSTDELEEALFEGQTLAEVAKANGLTRGELVDALLAEAEDLLALADEMDFFDQQQLTFIREWMTDVVELLVDHPLPIGPEWHKIGLHDWNDLLDAEDFDLPERLAELLGLTLEELQEALFDGASLAEVAKANGVALQTVVDFLIAAAEAELDKAVEIGHLTEEQAQVLLGWVEDAVARFVDNRLMLPNLFDLAGRLGDRFGTQFAPLGEINWEKWGDFDWHESIGQDPLAVTAETIGISQGELLEALMNGQSLAEIAQAHGVDPQVVVDAQTEGIESLLGDLVAQGLIPEDVPDLVKGRLGKGLKIFAEEGFPFNQWEGMHDGWFMGEWGGKGARWMELLCDCDKEVKGGE